MSSLIAIKWKDRDSGGFIDVFESSAFETEGRREEFVHQVVGPRHTLEHGRCSLTVSTRVADLDYGTFKAENEAIGWYIGILRLHFADTSRTRLAKVEWKDSGSKTFYSPLHQIIDEVVPRAAPYTLKRDSKKKSLRSVATREERENFKFELSILYGGRCCISRCPVSEALEGAHIDPYRGPLSNHIQNGLLMRRDLHALFDAGMLAIHPNSRRVYMARSARSFPEYEAIHKKVCLLSPSGGASYLPSKEALGRRWSKFDQHN